MKIKKITGIFAAVLGILLLTGCMTDYRSEAAEDAREYLLDNMEGLTVLQQNYIRYNDPIILNTMIWGSTVPSFIPDGHIVTRHERNVYMDPHRDMMMHCFGWRVPGMDKDILVVGTAQRDFRYWEPNRIVMRSRKKEDLAGMRIRRKAMSFAMIAFPELKGKIFHRVRYMPPDVHSSLFVLEPNTRKGKTESWMDFLEMSDSREPIQVSAVWIDPETKRRIVVIGVTADKELTMWAPKRVVELSEEDAKVYIGSKYTVFPKDSEDPFSPDFAKKEYLEREKEELRGKSKK